MRLGSPYFKLWPAVLPLLSNVNIEVPVDYLRLPFKAFVIRLPTENNPLAIDQQYFVRAILASEGQPDGDDNRRIYLWICPLASGQHPAQNILAKINSGLLLYG